MQKRKFHGNVCAYAYVAHSETSGTDAIDDFQAPDPETLVLNVPHLDYAHSYTS